MIGVLVYYVEIFLRFLIKVLDQNGPYINTVQTNLWNVCNSGILPVVIIVVCVFAPAFTCLCRSLEYLSKATYIILVDSLWRGFLTMFYSTVLKHCPMSEKISQYLHQTFTKCCLINIHILIYQMWLQVMEHPLVLLGIFINFWRLIMSESLYLHQTFTDCVSNTDMPKC